ESQSWLGAHGRHVAEIDRQCLVPHRLPVHPVEAEVDVLHEDVGGEDEVAARPWAPDGCVVADAHPKPPRQRGADDTVDHVDEGKLADLLDRPAAGRHAHPYTSLLSSTRPPSHAARYTAAVSRAVRSQENSRARASPRSRSSARSVASPMSRSIAAASASTSRGSTSSAASPATSGSDDVSDVITGAPQAMASSTGRPKPSYSEG